MFPQEWVPFCLRTCIQAVSSVWLFPLCVLLMMGFFYAFMSHLKHFWNSDVISPHHLPPTLLHSLESWSPCVCSFTLYCRCLPLNSSQRRKEMISVLYSHILNMGLINGNDLICVCSGLHKGFLYFQSPGPCDIFTSWAIVISCDMEEAGGSVSTSTHCLPTVISLHASLQSVRARFQQADEQLQWVPEGARRFHNPM